VTKFGTSLLLSALVVFSQPAASEDIAGFDFGGKFLGLDDAIEIKGETVLPHEYRVEDAKFFDRAEVGTNEKNIIRSLAFVKEYDVTAANLHVVKGKIKSDFERVLTTLENRWGEFDKKNARYVLGFGGESGLMYMGDVQEVATKDELDSPNVGRIMLALTASAERDFFLGETQEVTLSLLYLDKKMALNIEKNRAEELDGF